MKQRTTKLTDVLAPVVLAVFALCLLAVLLTGARSYAALTRAGSDSFSLRTVSQYLSTRVRQAEGLWVEDFGGCPALVICEELEGARYLTRVYCYDGHLRELYTPEDAVLSPSHGEKLIPVQELSFSLEDSVLEVQVDSRLLIFSLTHTGKEARP